MELNDFVYVTMLKNFNGVLFDDGKQYKVDIVYDRKSVDIAEAHWILTYMVSESSRSLEIGAMRWIKEEVVSIDVRTNNKEVYEILKKFIFTTFNVRTFDLRINNPVLVDCSDVKTKGVFLKIIRVYGDDNYVGQSIRCVYGNEVIEGVCIHQSGNMLYVFTANCIMILMSVFEVKDLSDRMRGMYRFVADIKASVIV